ncbi:uncharacterized protein LOC117182647 [Belonocnema kinseyi]|uniref:uncharacterized protein LOC117182647 n=1 Tax=Belonocnema kinseyi TaxID=2817044 RepID=UPI00143D4CD6|nr:uncharacterized protein LOC117182647 [Belonocnema kinseyi]
MTYIPHIESIAVKGSRTINIMRVIAKVTWGASPLLLLMVHKELVRACLEWGAPLFFCASKTVLERLGRVQYASIRVALGCMSSIPIPILLSEAGEVSLSLRRSHLANRYILRNFCWNDNPLVGKLSLLAESAKSKRFKVREEGYGQIEAYNSMAEFASSLDAPQKPSYFYEEWEDLSAAIPVDLEPGFGFREPSFSQRLLDSFVGKRYADVLRVFSDGSVNPGVGLAGCGFMVPESGLRFGVRLRDIASPITSELYGIFYALKYVMERERRDDIIFADSRSALTIIRDRLFNHAGHPLARLIVDRMAAAARSGVKVSLVWVPAHVGILGSERADEVARSASRLPLVVQRGIPMDDLHLVCQRDFRDWSLLCWPFEGTRDSRADYFLHANVKTPSPWFRDYWFPRRVINLITMLRSAQICTGEHFARMGWRVPVGCECDAEVRSLAHLLHRCPRLAWGRVAFY